MIDTPGFKDSVMPSVSFTEKRYGNGRQGLETTGIVDSGKPPDL
jgi:hypothetical protein